MNGGAKNCSMASKLDTGSPTDPWVLLRTQGEGKEVSSLPVMPKKWGSMESNIYPFILKGMNGDE